MTAVTFCALCAFQDYCGFRGAEGNEPGEMGHVQNRAAETEHGEASVSLLLSDKKVPLGRKCCSDWLVS